MEIVLYIAAFGILALCFWLIFRGDTAEPALNGWLSQRAATRDAIRELRRKRPPSDASYCVIALLPFIAIMAIWFLFH